jgi:hypothetical protein
MPEARVRRVIPVGSCAMQYSTRDWWHAPRDELQAVIATGWCAAGCLLSGGFGGGHGEGVIGEIGDEVQAAAECLDVAGDGLDG